MPCSSRSVTVRPNDDGPMRTWNDARSSPSSLSGPGLPGSSNQASSGYTSIPRYTVRFQVDYNQAVDRNEEHVLNGSAGFEVKSNKYNTYAKTTRGIFRDRGNAIQSDPNDDLKNNT